MRNSFWIILTCIAICIALSSPPAYCEVEFLDQNWNDATRQLFYTTSQGSRLIPYDWFLALETTEGNQSFLRTEVPKLGYLGNNNTLANPDRLPVGFVADTDSSGRRYLGMNCAACHTNRVQYGGKTFQVDGAPTLADMWGLLAGIGDSLNATATQDAKFGRFAEAVLGGTASPSEVQELRQDLSKFRSYWNTFISASKPDATGKLIWGRARLDAFGMIFNRVTSIDLDIPSNSSSPNAPVSYPFLWGTSAEDRVQWNASAPNTNDIERLGRNVGEVLGVFAAADLQKASILRPYYRTSARRLNQLRMENWLKMLWSPSWPSEFPSIDTAKRDAGKLLYDTHCLSCHKVIEHGKQSTPVKVGQIPVAEVGTDNRMALNAIIRKSDTGRLQGSVIPPDLDPLPANMPTSALVVNVVQGAVISPFHDVDTRLIGLATLKAKFKESILPSVELTHEEIQEFMKDANIHSEKELLDQLAVYRGHFKAYNQGLVEFANKQAQNGAASVSMESTPYVYKARPLDGIWATAPYLHNGSVPNLYEMLVAADKRTKVFHVGRSDYDPVKVGFSIDSGEGTTVFDTNLPGNSNSGHDQYGNKDFTEEQRLQLLEYLKSL